MEMLKQALTFARRLLWNTVQLIADSLLSTFDFMFYFGWMLMLIPTSQVYFCSPIKLENKLLGAMFRLQATSSEILEEAYTNSECFRNNTAALPYSMSVLPIRVKLILEPSELIKLDGDFYVAHSMRKVNGNSYTLSLAVQAHQLVSSFMSNEMKRKSGFFTNKHTLELEGTFENFLVWRNSYNDLKLSAKHSYLRPVLFKVLNARKAGSYSLTSFFHWKTSLAYGLSFLLFIIPIINLFCIQYYAYHMEKIYRNGNVPNNAQFKVIALLFKWINNARWMLVLLATFQTNIASPIAINNEELGLLVEMDKTENEFLTKTAETKIVPSTYKFSLHKPEIKIIMLPKDLKQINFRTAFRRDENNFRIEYFILETPRRNWESNVFMILETSGPDAEFLRTITQYGKKNRKRISITGAIKNLEEHTASLKDNLQTRFSKIRPIKMKISKVNFEYTDYTYMPYITAIIEYVVGMIYYIVVAVVMIWIFPVYVWAEIPTSIILKITLMMSAWFTLELFHAY